MTISARPLHDGGSSSIFTRMARIGVRAEAFQQRSLAPFGLRFIDFSLLRVLQLLEPPHEATPSELATHLVRSMAGVTQIVDRLVAQGLVTREPDPVDRRRILVALTSEGLTVVEAARIAYSEARARVLGQVEPADLEVADQVLRQLLALLGDDDARARAAVPPELSP